MQVMEAHVIDRARADALNQDAEPLLADEHPDAIGRLPPTTGGRPLHRVAYFTSEAKARESERHEMGPEMAERLADPWLTTA